MSTLRRLETSGNEFNEVKVLCTNWIIRTKIRRSPPNSGVALRYQNRAYGYASRGQDKVKLSEPRQASLGSV